MRMRVEWTCSSSRMRDAAALAVTLVRHLLDEHGWSRVKDWGADPGARRSKPEPSRAGLLHRPADDVISSASAGRASSE
jgi:hypothetical protein